MLATLIRLLGDFDRAEEAMHEAFAAAVEQWPRDGVPGNPRAWLVSAGRFKGIDSIRRESRTDGDHVCFIGGRRLHHVAPQYLLPPAHFVQADGVSEALHLVLAAI